MRLLLVALLPFTVACSQDEQAHDASDTAAADSAGDSAADSSPDAAPDSAADTADTAAPADRGPTRIALDGDANGLWWEAASQTLYIADDNGNRILSWTEAAGTRLVAELPAAAADGPGLGQLVKLPDGRIVVTRFGFGSAGDVVVVAVDGTSTVLAGLDPARRRIGLALAPDGALYSSWFTKTGQNPRVGAVGRLEIGDTPTEVAVVEGLGKPVGVLATATTLIISDQDKGQILVAQRADPSDVTVMAAVDGLDLIAFGPDGGVIVGGADGVVRLVSSAGAMSTVAGDFLQVRGVAFDAANRRVFAAEHDPDETDGIDHALHILPLD